jgi:hypothetical protein
MIEHIDRLKVLQALDLPPGIGRPVHQNRLLKNALRSGDIWVQGSRQFKDFDEYLLPVTTFASLKQQNELPLAIITDCDQYLGERLHLLKEQLATASKLAATNDLPDAIVTESGLRITPLDAAVP